MKYRIDVNGICQERIDTPCGPLVACALYIEDHIPPEEQRVIKGYCLHDLAVLKTPSYTIEARRVPELQHA